MRSNFKSEFSRSLEPLLSVMGKGRGDPHAGMPSGRPRVLPARILECLELSQKLVLKANEIVGRVLTGVYL